MKHIPVAGMMVLGLAACGGGGGGGGGQDFVLSSGILDLELPTAEDRAAFTEELDDAVTAIQTANEEGVAVTPSEFLTYSGVWGVGESDGDLLITGEVDGTFSTEGNTISLSFDVTDTSDETVSVSGSFSTGGMTVTDGLYSGGATGSFHTSGLGSSGSWDVSATIDGAIVDGSTFGSILGAADEVTEGDEGASVGFDGLYIADEIIPEP